jgi:hypothetical protein
MLSREFLKRPSQEKGDKNKERCVSSDKVGRLDMLKETFRQAKGELSRGKIQQREVGSSSEASKMVAIPENFKLVGGNTDLEKAQVILFAEAHISQHDKDIVDYINAHAKDGDIVLVESRHAGKEQDEIEYVVRKAITRGDLTEDQLEQAKKKQLDEYQNEFQKWCEQGVVRPFTKDVKIYGWDNMEAFDKMFLLMQKAIELRGKSSQKKEREEIWEKIYKLRDERDESMLKTINEMRNVFPDKRIFTIAGEGHVLNSWKKIKDQPCIALSPKYKQTEKDREGYERRTFARRKSRSGREEVTTQVALTSMLKRFKKLNFCPKWPF